MPKFIYTLGIIDLLLWVIIIKTMKTNPPESALIILIVLIMLYIALSLTTSLTYFVIKIKTTKITKPRERYRKVLKKSLYINLIVLTFFLIKAFT